MIPDPPLTADGMLATQHALLLVYIHRGVYGTCVMCRQMCYDWLDLTEAGMPPVTDDRGYPTDQVALHPQHVPDLLEYWATLMYGGPDDARGSHPVVRAAANDDRSTPAPTTPTGAYARALAPR